jgi:NAD(P)-dependent dehydrogenase (short-subunit alcohol dehydrogenase family)
MSRQLTGDAEAKIPTTCDHWTDKHSALNAERHMKTWFITGASRGFGASITEAALASGDAVVATARDPSSIADHPRLLKLHLDVTNEVQARDAAARGIERFGGIDVLVNNAGYGLLGAIEEASGPEVERLFATNVFGVLNVTRAVLPYMRKRRSGHIINMSSIGGYASYSGWGIYCATKFAVEALSEALSMELAPLGIHATVVEPGYFRTDFLSAQSLSSTATRIDDYADTVGRMRSFVATVNNQQPGDPKRLAQVIVQIASASEPPTRLALGSDTVARIEKKHRDVERELELWRSVSLSTNFTSVT